MSETKKSNGQKDASTEVSASAANGKMLRKWNNPELEKFLLEERNAKPKITQDVKTIAEKIAKAENLEVRELFDIVRLVPPGSKHVLADQIVAITEYEYATRAYDSISIYSFNKDMVARIASEVRNVVPYEIKVDGNNILINKSKEKSKLA
ncbi:MAG: hypothetical protein ACP5UH_03840 [Candidatus Micrarchaeia archaeon]